MALYSYQCHDCQQQFDLRRPMSQARDVATCPECSGQNTSKSFHVVSMIGVNPSQSAANSGGCASCRVKTPTACGSCR